MAHSAHQKVTEGRTDVSPTATSCSLQLHAGLLPLLLGAATRCAALTFTSQCHRELSTLTPLLLITNNMLTILKGNYLQFLP